MKGYAAVCAGVFGLLVVSAAPFSSNTLSVLRVGQPGQPAASGKASAVYVDEFSTAGTLIQSIATNLTLDPGDHLAGDLVLGPDGCYLTFLAYGGLSPGDDAKGLTKALVAAMLHANGTLDTSTRWNFTGVGYSTARGVVRSPYGGGLYALAGQSGSCALALLPAGVDSGDIPHASLIIDPQKGFAARGIGIAGSPGEQQLYVGSGSLFRRVGSGLPTAAGATTSNVIQAGFDIGAGWEFANDTQLWIVDKDNVNATVRTAHTYWCSGDSANNPCPEGGSWARDTAVSIPCNLTTANSTEPEPQNLFYLSANFTGSAPLFYATDDGSTGASEVLRLDTATGACTELVPPQTGVVYRGVALSPVLAACYASPSPTRTPTSSPTASRTSTSSVTASPSRSPSPSPSVPQSASPSPSPSPSLSPSPSPAAAAAASTGLPPGPAAGTAVGVIVGAGLLGFLALQRGWVTVPPAVAAAGSGLTGRASSAARRAAAWVTGSKYAPLLPSGSPGKLAAVGSSPDVSLARARALSSSLSRSGGAGAGGGGGGGGGGYGATGSAGGTGGASYL